VARPSDPTWTSAGAIVDAAVGNILFDALLSGLGSAFSLIAGEKIAVSLAALIFLWGRFTLLCSPASASRGHFCRLSPCCGFCVHFSVPVHLYLATQMGIFFLPSAVYLPKYVAPLSMLLERLSLVSAVMGCCVLSTIKPQKWYAVGLGAIAAAFFMFLYQDTALLSRMEDGVDRLVQTLPPGQRVLEAISTEPGWRAYIAARMLDRACFGHCFAYGNYEPSSNQFRLRAAPENRIVMTSYDDTESMERGGYMVKPADLPAYQVYQCSPSVSDLCIRRLDAGEMNNHLGMHPEGLPH
jgi:hypothetical protein